MLMFLMLLLALKIEIEDNAGNKRERSVDVVHYNFIPLPPK